MTGQPIAGARVTIYPIDPAGQGGPFARPAVLTDARGRFVFVDLPSARYNLFTEHVGHNVGEYEGPAPAGSRATAPSGQSVSIKLADGEWMRDANIRMWRFTAISGRVVDEKNEAVIGCAVRLFTRRLVAGHEQLVQGPVATTDDQGAYRFPFLEPGSYFVAVLSVQATVPATVADAARRPPIGAIEGRGGGAYFPPTAFPTARGASIDVDGGHRLVLTSFATPPPPGADGPRAYAPIFYPNGRAVTEAQAVQLGIGTSRDGVDFQLSPISTFRVSGHVTGAVESAANLPLRLMAPGTEHLGFGAEVATTMIEADGTFTFLNVPAGTYTLVASRSVAEVTGGGSSQGTLPKSVGYGSAQGYSMSYPAAPGLGYMWWQSPTAPAVWGRTQVSVGAANATAVDLMLQTGAKLSGRVVFDDPVQPEGQFFTVSLEPANGDPWLGAPFTSMMPNDASHSFTLDGLRSGRYFAGLQPARGWRIASVTTNGVDVTDAGFDGSLGSNYDDVVITMTKAGAQLSGVVRDGRGQPAQGAVMVFPVDPKRWVDYGLTGARLRSTSADSSGAYRINLLPDGDYFVVAVPQGQRREWLDPKFLATAAGKATRVTLATGASKVQDLQLSEVIVK
jgi:hypothetical protein